MSKSVIINFTTLVLCVNRYWYWRNSHLLCCEIWLWFRGISLTVFGLHIGSVEAAFWQPSGFEWHFSVIFLPLSDHCRALIVSARSICFAPQCDRWNWQGWQNCYHRRTLHELRSMAVSSHSRRPIKIRKLTEKLEQKSWFWETRGSRAQHRQVGCCVHHVSSCAFSIDIFILK